MRITVGQLRSLIRETILETQENRSLNEIFGLFEKPDTCIFKVEILLSSEALAGRSKGKEDTLRGGWEYVLQRASSDKFVDKAKKEIKGSTYVITSKHNFKLEKGDINSQVKQGEEYFKKEASQYLEQANNSVRQVADKDTDFTGEVEVTLIGFSRKGKKVKPPKDFSEEKSGVRMGKVQENRRYW